MNREKWQTLLQKPTWANAWWMALVVGLVVVAGSSVFVFYFPFQPDRDATEFIYNARVIAGAEEGPIQPMYFRYIGYSLLISIPQDFLGLGRTGVKVTNLLMHLTMSLLIFAFLKKQLPRLPLAAPLGMLMAGCHPLALYMTGMILTENLFIFLLAGLFMVSVCISRTNDWKISLVVIAFMTALVFTRPTGIPAVALLTLVGLVGFTLQKRWKMILVALAWIPLFLGADALFHHLWAAKNAPVPKPKKAAAQPAPAHWLVRHSLFHTYKTTDGDSWDAARRRQKEFARTETKIVKIADFMHGEWDKLILKILEEARQRGAHIPQDADDLRTLPADLTWKMLFDNIRRHPFHVAGHYLRNAFFNMWFIRDNLRNTPLLVAMNLPYLLLLLAGIWGFCRKRQWPPLLILAAIVLPIWGIHTLVLAHVRYALPFFPLFAVAGLYGLGMALQLPKEKA